MLHEFLTTNRTQLIDRCRAKVAKRSAPKVAPLELEHGVPLVLDQIIKTLELEQTSEPERSVKVSGTSDHGTPDQSEIGATATRHGRELLKQGATVDQVVHDYGDLCQAITELASEARMPILAAEFRTVNLCLDNAIAGAVTEFAYQHDTLTNGKGAQALDERLRALAHELRGHIQTAALTVSVIKAGKVGLTGATGTLLDQSLVSLQRLVDRSLADAWATAGLTARYQVISLAGFIAEAEISASLEAQARECKFTVAEVDEGLAIDADRDMLLSAIGNLLQNAFKFTGPHTEVSLSAYSAGDRILIDIADRCGGLPPGDPEKMFLASAQSGAEKSGLGLSICRRNVEANNGVLRVRDMPGSGCVFTIDLPRHLLQ